MSEKPIKFCVVMLVSNMVEFIRAAIDSAYPHVDKFLVHRNSWPWNKPEVYREDGTEAVLNEMVASGKYPNLRVNHGFFPTEMQTRDWMLDQVRTQWPDITHVVVLDADEAMNVEDWNRLKKFVADYDRDADIFYVERVTYWKSFDWVIYPPERVKFLAVHKTSLAVGYHTNHRDIGEGRKRLIPPAIARQHHFSYVRATDRKIQEKVETFMHRDELVPGWFERVWERWTPEMIDLHPTHPNCYERALPSDPSQVPPDFAALKSFWKERDPEHAVDKEVAPTRPS